MYSILTLILNYIYMSFEWGNPIDNNDELQTSVNLTDNQNEPREDFMKILLAYEEKATRDRANLKAEVTLAHGQGMSPEEYKEALHTNNHAHEIYGNSWVPESFWWLDGNDFMESELEVNVLLNDNANMSYAEIVSWAPMWKKVLMAIQFSINQWIKAYNNIPENVKVALEIPKIDDMIDPIAVDWVFWSETSNAILYVQKLENKMGNGVIVNEDGLPWPQVIQMINR